MKYIAINPQSDQTSERDLRSDVGDFAYVDHGTIAAPFDVTELKIGSYRHDGEDWANVENAPNLPSKGYLFVKVSAGTTKEIRFVADEMRDENCIKSRCGELIVINGVAESWNYYVSNDETFQFGEIALPSAFNKGLAKDTKLRTLAADYVRQYAKLNRGKRVGDINFNTTITNGDIHIEFSGSSLFAPPTNENKGVLKNEIAGCVIFQYFYPDNSEALYTRERNESKIWTSWYTASAGNMLADGKVKVPTHVKRGIGSGYQFVEVYQAWKAEEKFNLIEGFGIQITDSPSGKIVSWTGNEVPFAPQYPLEYDAVSGNLGLNSTLISNWNSAYGWGNHALAGYLTGFTETDPTVPSWVKAITSTQISNWNAAYSWGNHAGLYAPLSRALQVSGTAGRVAVSGGSQTLAADRSWVVDLIAVNATTLSAGSTTQVPVINVDTYGRVTSLSNASIAFPAETDPTVPSWVKAITSTQVSNWNAAYSWGNHAGLYAPLARALQVSGTAGRVAVSGGSQTLAADRSWVVDLIAVNATTLSAGSTTQVPVINVDTYGRVTSLSNAAIAFPAETDPTVPSWVKAITSTQVSNWNAAYSWGNHALAGYLTSYTETDPTVPSWVKAITSTQISNWNAAYSWGNHAGLYAPLARALQVSGTAGRVAVSGGSQTLAADRSWVVDLIAVNATTLSAGSTTQVPVINVDTYGRVISLSNTEIAFPAETDPTVPSWVKTISSTNIANWNSAYGWGNHALAGYLTSYTETDPTVPSHVKAITTENISSWNAKLSGTGDVNYLGKFTAPGIIGNSRIFDNGTVVNIASANTTGLFNVGGNTNIFGNLAVGGNDAAGYRLRLIDGALYADGDLAAVSIYIPSGRAIRATGTLNIDAGTASPIYFRSGGGATYIMELNSNGKVRFNTYYSASSWSGTPVALLGTDNGGNVLTISTSLYAPVLHSHPIGDIINLASELGNRPTWGDVYTRYQLNTSGAGGAVHWNNVTNKPDFAYAGHGHPIGDIINLASELGNRPTWGDVYTRYQLNTSGAGGAVHWDNVTNRPDFAYTGHGHPIGDIINLASELGNRPTWGDVYTRYQLNTSGAGGAVHWDNVSNKPPFITSESDPKGYAAHWLSIAGSTLTVGIQLRDGGQYYANVNLPSSGGGNYLDKTAGVGNTIYSYNVFEYPTVFNTTAQFNGGIYMNSQHFSLFPTQTLGATPTISSEVLPINIGGVTKYILLKS
ncbi:hypothetical protein [Runella sp. SP2]|uniref:hypothetical protein n=1 Tax=Runella sp. SP2 TaxID=2268026 RepID=UPI0013DDF2C2|nr:hypothetical protein [Runella sp. SP2]